MSNISPVGSSSSPSSTAHGIMTAGAPNLHHQASVNSGGSGGQGVRGGQHHLIPPAPITIIVNNLAANQHGKKMDFFLK